MPGVHSFSRSVFVVSMCGYEIKGRSFVPIFKLKVHESYLECSLVHSDNYEHVVRAMIALGIKELKNMNWLPTAKAFKFYDNSAPSYMSEMSLPVDQSRITRNLKTNSIGLSG